MNGGEWNGWMEWNGMEWNGTIVGVPHWKCELLSASDDR